MWVCECASVRVCERECVLLDSQPKSIDFRDQKLFKFGDTCISRNLFLSISSLFFCLSFSFLFLSFFPFLSTSCFQYCLLFFPHPHSSFQFIILLSYFPTLLSSLLFIAIHPPHPSPSSLHSLHICIRSFLSCPSTVSPEQPPCILSFPFLKRSFYSPYTILSVHRALFRNHGTQTFAWSWFVFALPYGSVFISFLFASPLHHPKDRHFFPLSSPFFFSLSVFFLLSLYFFICPSQFSNLSISTH